MGTPRKSRLALSIFGLGVVGASLTTLGLCAVVGLAMPTKSFAFVAMPDDGTGGIDDIINSHGGNHGGPPPYPPPPDDGSGDIDDLISQWEHDHGL